MSIDFSGITLPFSPADLLSSGVGILMIVGGFVLLGLAFPMAQKFIGAIVTAFRQGSSASK